MSTVKISELIELPLISANTSNTIFLGVDLPTGITGRFTATTLAQQLYANNNLNVGNHSAILPNAIGQFAGIAENYLQVSIQNDASNGSSDYVVTGDIGTDETHYIDLGLANSTDNDPNYTSIKALDGYLYVQGGESSANAGGNLVMGVVTQNRDINFIQGGSAEANIVAKFSYGNGFKLTQKPIIFADATSQNTAASPASYSQASFQLANTNANNISTLIEQTQAVFNLANTNSNTITYITDVNTAQNTYASAAFAKANAALANATGTFAGDLTITGNTFAQAMNTTTLQVVGATNISGTLGVTGAVSMNAQLVLSNVNFSATEAVFRITAAESSQPVTQDGTLMQLTGKANTPARVLVDSFSISNTAYPIIAGRNARGTVNTPTATQNNDILLRIAGNSYGTTGYAPFGDARIDFVATENHSDTARGSRIRFWNTPNGSTVVNEIASFNADSVEFTGTVKPDKGFIYTPRLPVGNQTAITIDFSSDVIIKANLAADLTFTLSNFVFGKVVEVWLTNTSGLTRTITHGCSSINSSENATTFTMPSTSSAYLRYFSIDGDLANTFVAIQHA